MKKKSNKQMRKQIQKKQDAAENDETFFCCSAFRAINR